ncbi:hypothetical protein [Melissospora conviva]|uniref:hypothetical protein n=1 Tax=Melissospora conviva TaxID=3388432 RepID=UPI003C28EDBC
MSGQGLVVVVQPWQVLAGFGVAVGAGLLIAGVSVWAALSARVCPCELDGDDGDDT